MIPVFDHCQDCGTAPIVLTQLWQAPLAMPIYWCRECRKVLVPAERA